MRARKTLTSGGANETMQVRCLAHLTCSQWSIYAGFFLNRKMLCLEMDELWDDYSLDRSVQYGSPLNSGISKTHRWKYCSAGRLACHRHREGSQQRSPFTSLPGQAAAPCRFQLQFLLPSPLPLIPAALYSCNTGNSWMHLQQNNTWDPWKRFYYFSLLFRLNTSTWPEFSKAVIIPILEPLHV